MNISAFGIISSILILIGLLLSSALISGSEIAFFSLSPKDEESLKVETTPSSIAILKLLENPSKLLATILIANNFINIGIVILSSFVLNLFIPAGTVNLGGQWLSEHVLSFWTSVQINSAVHFLITVVAVTFLLVLFGEVAPKIYASFNNLRFSKLMARPLKVLNTLFGPISNVLVNMSQTIEKKLASSTTSNSTKEDIDQAIELAVNQHTNEESEADILRSIIKFTDLSVKQIMQPRTEVVGFEKSGDYHSLTKLIRESGYSRIPIFEENLDTIVGILYVKDLISHITETKDFNWAAEIRNKLIFVPETKKVNELLKDFQRERVHMAIVVDEYGGVSGLVTLEDVMEEVIGDIKDEFDDEEEMDYVKIDDNNYIFEGKTSLTDVARIIDVDSQVFDRYKGDSDSLAGLILEILGVFPKPDKEIKVEDIKLKVVSVNKRRIEKVSLTINR
ncbi:gliding motility-associated protein GldE [Saprospiraceae bacterium]|nr:gliding motility-associated protein GldE [Saprospiraceae bacterium]